MSRSGQSAGKPVFEPHPPIDVLINVVGPWTTVRVQQPFEALRGLGWDVRFHQPPLDLNKAVRPNSLVIWQRPVPVSWAAWLEIVQLVRRRGSLLLVEWDDHPALFPQSRSDSDCARQSGAAPPETGALPH